MKMQLKRSIASRGTRHESVGLLRRSHILALLIFVIGRGGMHAGSNIETRYGDGTGY